MTLQWLLLLVPLLALTTAEDDVLASLCSIAGASYGRPLEGSSSSADFASIVGLACADSNDGHKCYQQASAWSEVAVAHGNRPVEDANECLALCQATEECEVWNFWPNGVGVTQPEALCDLCPKAEGGTVHREQGYCIPDTDDCGLCGDMYDYFALTGVQRGADFTCQDVGFFFSELIGCCTYSEEAKNQYQPRGACELLSADSLLEANDNNNSVIVFHDYFDIATGPKDCESTQWLPFLQSVQHPSPQKEEERELPYGIDFEENGYCDPCPAAHGLILQPNNTYFDDDANMNQTCAFGYNFVTTQGVPGVSCIDIVNWMKEESDCCDWSAFEPENEHHDKIDYEEQGFCDPCPASHNFILDSEREFEDENSPTGRTKCGDVYEYIKAGFLADIPCKDMAQWMLTESLCCAGPPTETPTIAPTQPDSRPRASDGRLCWVSKHSYGVAEHGACADAPIVAVYATNKSIAIGHAQGWWWDDIHLSAIHAHDDDNNATESFEVEDCYMACLDHEECGGWEMRDGVCLLRAALDCTPTLGKNPSASYGWAAGVKGCVDSNSEDPQEQSALDIDNLWFSNCDLPRCTKPMARNSIGAFAGDTYIPDVASGADGCWYKQYTPDELYRDCTKDRWIVINGGSNTLSFYSQMVNLFSPIQRAGALRPLIGFEETFQYSIIDIVFRSDSLPILDSKSPDILHMNLKMLCEIVESLSCEDEENQFSLTFHGGKADWPASYVQDIERTLAEAPYEPGATRVTLIVGQLWTNAEAALIAVGGQGASNGWEKVNVLFYGQAMIWYPCNVEGWCELEDLGSSDEEMFEKYSTDLNRVMEAGKATCATDRFDCFFGSHAYGGSSLGGKAERMISILEEKTNAYEWAHFLEYNLFTQPDEVLEGHVTPSMFLTSKTMIWNTICPGPEKGCPEAIASTPTCWAGCAERGGGDTCGNFCNDWMCVNERQCDYTVLDPVPYEVIVDLPATSARAAVDAQCFDAAEIGRLYSAMLDERDESDCKRIWCGSPGAGWALGLVAFLAGLAIILVPTFQDAQEPQQASREAASMLRNHSTKTAGVSDGFGLNDKNKEQPQEAAMDAEQKSNAPRNLETSGVSSTSDKDQDSEAKFSEQGSQRVEPTATVPAAADLENQNLKAGVTAEKGSVAVPKKEHLASLGMARLIASQHIVVGHLYAEGAVDNHYFLQWGYTWVPWFFVLSGYVLTHARLNSRDASLVDGPYNHVAKRLSSIFPMYAFGVFLTMIIRVANDVSLPSIEVLIGQSFLLQAWIPQWTEHALLSQCWFLSGLLVYWAIYKWLYKLLRRLNLVITFGLLVFACFLPWLTIIVPVADDDIETDWYTDHRWGKMDSATDVWTVMLKFHPVFYVHVFVFGMLLAILRNHLKNNDNQTLLAVGLRRLIQFGATLGYLGLILMFSVEAMKPTSHKLSARMSVLLPLQGLMMLGLSPLPSIIENNGFQDPLAILFSYAPAWIGDVSYCQYVLQFIMHDLFPTHRIDDPSFFLYLWGGSMIAYKLIQKPAAKLWRSLLPKKDEPLFPFLPSVANAAVLMVPPVILAIVLAIAEAAYEPNSARTVSNQFLSGNGTNATNATLLPPFVRLAPEAVDLKLNWTMHDGNGETMAINPSMLFVDDGSGKTHFVRAMRAHAIEESTGNGLFEEEPVTEQIMHFHSSILISSEPFPGNLDLGFDDESIQKWGLDGTSALSSTSGSLLSHRLKNATWKNLCEPYPSYNRADRRIVRKVVSGPEDPKLFLNPGNDSRASWSLTYSSFPPASLLTDGSATEDCQWSDQAVMQMYLASDGPSLASGEPALGVRLDFGDGEEMEKNWIAFTHNDDLYYIYSVQPHVVVKVRSTDGAASLQHRTVSKQLKAVAGRVHAIRGSATAVKYSDSEYLAVMHTYDPSHGYSTAAYTFEASPPFAVRRISKPLPLHGHSFPSSLVLRSDKVLIGYGEADKSSRVLVMSRNHLEHKYFDWCS